MLVVQPQLSPHVKRLYNIEKKIGSQEDYDHKPVELLQSFFCVVLLLW